MRYKLVATDFDGNTTVINDWETIPAGQDRIVTLSQLVDQNLECYRCRINRSSPRFVQYSAVTAPTGWGHIQ